MTGTVCRFAAACGLLVAALFTETAFAQKQGGILKVYHWDNPPSMSIHEEATISTVVPMMGVFNNLVMSQQDVPHYQVVFEFMGGAVDDPDAMLYQNYGCGGELNYTGYCDREVEKMFDQQSMELNQEKRRNLVWEIERKLATDGARLIIHHARTATCWQPGVKGLTIMVNSQYNGWRMEDVWLDN